MAPRRDLEQLDGLLLDAVGSERGEVGATGCIEAAGGVLCGECRPGKRQVVSISAGVLRAMIVLAEADGERWQQLSLDSKTRGELWAVLNHYLTHLLGHKPRMHEYLAGMTNDSA